MICPRVVDLSHYDDVTDNFHGAVAFGIWGVIQKCTESLATDPLYAYRRNTAKSAGLLWGAYHFIRPGNIAAQADHFLNTARPDAHTLLALDYEDNNVGLAAAGEWIALVEKQSGHSVVLYSGNTIKEKLGSVVSPWWGARRLWLAQYASFYTVQASWRSKGFWLWQYTGDGNGPNPHTVPGIKPYGAMDINHYGGTLPQLQQEWAGSQHPPAHTPAPTPVSAPPEPPSNPWRGGKGSWYSQYQGRYIWHDSGDAPGSSALGVPDRCQGISFYNHGTLGKWFQVRAPNGRISLEQQTDIGPSMSTGRLIDISAAAAERFGYSPNNFPTNGHFEWRQTFPPTEVASMSPHEQATHYAELRTAVA